MKDVQHAVFTWKPALGVAALLAALAGCSDGPRVGPTTSIDDFCFDGDGDGYGSGCELGADCNDDDSEVHENCGACATPEEGCECEIGTPPVECVGSAEKGENSYVCTGGTRYCRDGQWSACTELVSFETTVPKALERVVEVRKKQQKQNGVRKQGMDAGTGDTMLVDCGACQPSCFATEDPINSGLAGDSGLIFGDGGLTLPEWTYSDAAIVDGCATDDSDCDGIPDAYDTWEGGAPISSTHDTVYFQLDPGQSGSTSVDIDFQLRRADIYFLLDNTSSMSGELNNLRSDLQSGSFLTGSDATDPCRTDPDVPAGFDYSSRKSGGILGNIACLMPGTQFGAGFYGDVPFAYTGSGWFAGMDGRGQNQVNSVPFYNLQDITSAYGDVQDALDQVTIAADGAEIPEGAMFAMYSLATGEQIYNGWDRAGIAPRPEASCPDDTFGSACFREDALPIIINLSDAAFNNGPYLEGWAGFLDWLFSLFDPDDDGVNDEFCYSQSEYQCSGLLSCLLSFVTSFIGEFLCALGLDLGLPGLTRPDFPIDVPNSRAQVARQGTVAEYIPTYPYTNEDFATTLDLGSLSIPSGGMVGSLDGQLLTFTGDTRDMSSDVDLSGYGCGTLGTGNDATFSFHLDSTQNVTLSTQGSLFDATLALLEGDNVVEQTTTGTGNDAPADAFPINGGSPLPMQFNHVMSGSTAGLSADIPWSTFGPACRGSSVDDTAPDALFRFTPSFSGGISIEGGGTSAPMAVALFDEEPFVPIRQSLPNNASMDIIGAFGGIDLHERDYTYTGGNSAVAAIDNDYGASIFESLGCMVDEGGSDAVIDFSLSEATRVEITSGNGDLSGGAFDHALALVRRSGGSLPSSPTSPLLSPGATYETAPALASQASLNNNWYRYQGNLSGTGDDYDDLELGGIAPSVCDLDDNANDAVYELNITSPTWVELSASPVAPGAFEPVVSLHEDFIGCVSVAGTTSVTQNGTDTLTGSNLGEVDYTSVMTVRGTTNGFNRSFTGDGGWGADGAMSCISSSASHEDARDVVYRFSVGSGTHNLQLQLAGDNDRASLAVFRNLTGDNTSGQLACSYGSGTRTINLNNASGTYYVLVKAGSGSNDGDSYTLTINNSNPDLFTLCPNLLNGTTVDASPGVSHDTFAEAEALSDLYSAELVTLTGNLSGATTGGVHPSCGAGGRKTWYSFTPSEDTTLEFTTQDANNNGMNMTLALFASPPASFNDVECESAGGAAPANAATLTANVSAGTTYYLLVQGADTGLGFGDFEVVVNDTVFTGLNDPFVDCAESGSSLTQYLEPGTYYVTVSANTAITSGSYNLDIKMGNTIANLGGEMLSCRQGNLGSGETRIDETLPAGDYSVIVRGVAPGDEGNFGVRIRDYDAAASGSAIACHQPALVGSGTAVGYPVVAGQEYWIAVRGQDADDEGDYEVNVYNAEVGTSLSMNHCFNPAGDRVDGQAQVTRTLAPGDYTIVLAGQDASESGPFQLTVGNRGLQSTLAWDAPNYYGSDGTGATDGILHALNERDIRVVNVMSTSNFSFFGVSFGQDEQAISQALSIANDTNTRDTSGNPLIEDRAPYNGSGMGGFIINAVQELVNTLQMDVTLRLNYLDDPPASSGFDFLVQASGSECSGVVDTTGNGTADTHQNCNPGSVPTFDVTFTNPADDPVPPNETADDALGGYHMAIDVIGDGRFLIEQIPVYIIPEVIPAGPTSAATGSTTQDTVASGCIETERPMWSGLSWTADIPEDTRLTFRMCTAETQGDLDGCDMRTVAYVTTDGTSCTGDGDCTNGFCQAGVCQYPRSGEDECEDDQDCGVGGNCLTASGTCAWNNSRIDPRPALVPGMQGLPAARLEVELRSTDNQSAAPTLYDYELSYTCTPFE